MNTFIGGRTTFAPTRTTLRTSVGEGFRAPQPVELDDPFVGNADLGPKTLWASTRPPSVAVRATSDDARRTADLPSQSEPSCHYSVSLIE